MKKNANPFLNYLLKSNLVYVIFLVVLLVLTFTLLPYMVSKYSDNQRRVSELETNILSNRSQNSISQLDEEGSLGNLDDDLKIINALVPDSENYFSIIYSLEQLSNKSNFLVTQYTINLEKSTTNKLSVTVSGIGDQNAFLEFLKNYNFGGGRLITAERIELNKELNAASTLNLNFYTKKSTLSNLSSADYKKTLSRFSQIKDKVDISFQSQLSENPSQEYPVKSNPF